MEDALIMRIEWRNSSQISHADGLTEWLPELLPSVACVYGHRIKTKELSIFTFCDLLLLWHNFTKSTEPCCGCNSPRVLIDHLVRRHVARSAGLGLHGLGGLGPLIRCCNGLRKDFMRIRRQLWHASFQNYESGVKSVNLKRESWLKQEYLSFVNSP